ncbi:hypothetical protein V9T40_003886 [Parthenolecanium corni]|uniref:GON-4-like protein n=1 Tax=Parthenolecanium corni TaxID=536013 RepID=A0AAN9Y4A8_9HEMI
MKKSLKFDDEPRRKRRRKKSLNKNEKMRNIIIDIEKEIEEQLDAKTEDNDFTTSNVKGILKELIMDEDMKEMVRQTLHPGDRADCYEPKLTRAKVRKLLEEKPDLKIPILWPIPQNSTNFVSECLSLINENYTENSSEDEEYKPDADEIDYVDYLFEEKTSSHDISSTSGNFNPEMDSMSSDSSSHSIKVEENIGQRTRSKLPLTETRLEDIEQTFNPPDITTDMYDFEIDNEDYLNFLRTYECGISELADMDDDPDDDPEYRVPADAETVDREELRQDESTEVSSVEVWNLIEEFIVCNDSMKTFSDRRKSTETNSGNAEIHNDDSNSSLPVKLETEEVESNPSPHQNSAVLNQIIEPASPVKSDIISLEEKVLTESSNSISSQNEDIKSPAKPNILLNAHQIIVSPERPRALSPLKMSEQSGPVLSKQQRLLFEQQLRQHVQLTTMHFLQCYKHPTLYKLASEMKNLLTYLQLLTESNKKSAYNASNLDDSLKLISSWEQVMVNVPDPETNFFAKQKGPARNKRHFSPDFMKMVCKSNVFLYPLLLPEKPFSGYIETIRRKELTKSEEWLLAVGLQQFYEYVENINQQSDSNTNTTHEALKLTIHYLLPNYTPSFLLHIIKKKENDDPDSSSIKYYLEHKKAPPLKHFVVPVSPFPLFKQPYDLLPKIWQDYISRNFVVLRRR